MSSVGERFAPSLGATASFAACAARASVVQTLPVMTAAAPMTAFRTIKLRRSILAGRFSAGRFSTVGNSGKMSWFLSVEDGVLMMVLVAGLMNLRLRPLLFIDIRLLKNSVRPER